MAKKSTRKKAGKKRATKKKPATRKKAKKKVTKKASKKRASKKKTAKKTTKKRASKKKTSKKKTTKKKTAKKKTAKRGKKKAAKPNTKKKTTKKKTAKRTAKKTPARKKAAKSSAKKSPAKRTPPKKAPTEPMPISSGKGASPAEIGQSLLNMLNSGTPESAIWDTHFSKNFESIEGSMGMVWKGRKLVQGKAEWWYANNEVHGVAAEGPFIGATGFSVIYRIDATDKESGKRIKAEEVGVYTVENGKVVREEFMGGKMETVSQRPEGHSEQGDTVPPLEMKPTNESVFEASPSGAEPVATSAAADTQAEADQLPF